MPESLVLPYQRAARGLSDAEKAHIISEICARLWIDEDFFRAVVAYAESARSDLYGDALEETDNGR